MTQNFKLLIGFIVCSFLGCAATLTKSNFDQINLAQEKKKHYSALFRFYEKLSIIRSNTSVIYFDENYSRQLKQVLLDSQNYSQVTDYKPKIERLTFTGDNSKLDIEAALKVNFPILEDIFIDVESQIKEQDRHGNAYWGLFHVASLGLIPIVFDNDINLKVTIYDKNGTILAQNTAIDKSNIWCWTPLFLFNGFHMFRPIHEVASPIRQNTFRYLLNSEKLTYTVD